MHILTIFSVIAAVSTCHGFLADVLGGLGNTDPFLIEFCRPLAAPAHGRVYCQYDLLNLTCTATCDIGYGSAYTSMTRRCELSEKLWGMADPSFPPCRSKPSSTSQNGACIQTLDECIALGNGDYPSCTGCHQFVTCANDGIHVIDCPNNLKFDNNLKQCRFTSQTCM